jgi:hypothetical protein
MVSSGYPRLSGYPGSVGIYRDPVLLYVTASIVFERFSSLFNINSRFHHGNVIKVIMLSDPTDDLHHKSSVNGNVSLHMHPEVMVRSKPLFQACKTNQSATD